MISPQVQKLQLRGSVCAICQQQNIEDRFVIQNQMLNSQPEVELETRYQSHAFSCVLASATDRVVERGAAMRTPHSYRANHCWHFQSLLAKHHHNTDTSVCGQFDKAKSETFRHFRTSRNWSSKPTAMHTVRLY
jgi:hypothetical protein